MKLSIAAMALALSSCAVYEPVVVPVKQPPSGVPVKPWMYAGHDAAYTLIRRCDSLGFVGSDHRLCMLRGIDNLEVKQSPVIDLRQYAPSSSQAAPISLPPYGWQPQFAVPVAPVK